MRLAQQKEDKTYRLPTDREWSFAAGIGQSEKWKADTTPAAIAKDSDEFPWGRIWPPPKSVGNYSDQSRKANAPANGASYLDRYDDGFPPTAPVMSFKPNKAGLYDMGGNAAEWVEDWSDESKTNRVARGSSWRAFRRDAMLSSHSEGVPGSGTDTNYGFRIVLELPQ